MKVILLEEVHGKGGEGDVVDVARGFANNYLLKNKMAVLATPGNLKQLEQRRKNIAKREEVRINGAQTRKGQLEAMTVIIATKVGEEGQLFGSVTAAMIAEAIASQNEAGLEVDRRRIDVRTPIKTVGDHEVEISLYREIKATLKIKVVDEAHFEDESLESAVSGEATIVAEKSESSQTEESSQEAEADEGVETNTDSVDKPEEVPVGANTGAVEKTLESVATEAAEEAATEVPEN